MSEMNESDKPFGKPGIQPKKVIEEDASVGPWAQFGKQVQSELDQSSRSPYRDTAIQGMGSSIYGSYTSSMDRVLEIVMHRSKPILRVLIFVTLVSMLYSWNKRLFSLGDFQVIDDRRQKCADINRFDYSAKAWHEKLIILNDNNLKARSASSKDIKKLAAGLKTTMVGMSVIEGLSNSLDGMTEELDPVKPAKPFQMYKSQRFDKVKLDNPNSSRENIDKIIKSEWDKMRQEDRAEYHRKYELDLAKFKEDQKKYTAKQN